MRGYSTATVIEKARSDAAVSKDLPQTSSSLVASSGWPSKTEVNSPGGASEFGPRLIWRLASRLGEAASPDSTSQLTPIWRSPSKHDLEVAGSDLGPAAISSTVRRQEPSSPHAVVTSARGAAALGRSRWLRIMDLATPLLGDAGDCYRSLSRIAHCRKRRSDGPYGPNGSFQLASGSFGCD